MRRAQSLIIALAALAATAAPAAARGLHVRGNRLVAGAGRAVALPGVNRSGTEYACIQGWGLFDGPNDAASVRAMASEHIPLRHGGLPEPHDGSGGQAGAADLRRGGGDLRRLELCRHQYADLLGLGRRPPRGVRRLDVGHVGNCESLISSYKGTPANAYGAFVKAHYAGVAASERQTFAKAHYAGVAASERQR
jgi:hypothetical protein